MILLGCYSAVLLSLSRWRSGTRLGQFKRRCSHEKSEYRGLQCVKVSFNLFDILVGSQLGEVESMGHKRDGKRSLLGRCFARRTLLPGRLVTWRWRQNFWDDVVMASEILRRRQDSWMTLWYLDDVMTSWYLDDVWCRREISMTNLVQSFLSRHHVHELCRWEATN